MNELSCKERMMAAIRGKPFDKYPFVHPYPEWSMMPHWPKMLGLTFLHLDHGSDDERLRCCEAFCEILGSDWMKIHAGPCGLDKRYRIETDNGVPVLVDMVDNIRRRFEEFPKGLGVSEPQYNSAREVEALPPPPTADEMLAGDGFDMAKKVVERYGKRIFLMSPQCGPFYYCFCVLGFEKLYDSLINDPRLVHALLERQTEVIIQSARVYAKLCVHGMHILDCPCGAEILSEEHYLEFVFPYERKALHAIRENGLVSILEYSGWVEPRLPHIARLEVDCLHTESSMKGYRNDVGKYRKVLGEEVCILGNSRIREVIEQGDEEVWRQDAIEQARGIGKQRRYVICAGGPTTWATCPERVRRFGEFMREGLAGIVPPLGSTKNG